MSKKSITGEFIKQQWNDNNHAVEVGREEFDATNYVLLMDLSKIHSLADKDGDYETDEIGREFVMHDGPFSISVVGSICKFFGVESPTKITQAQLDAARIEYAPKPAEMVRVYLTIALDILVQPGVNSVREVLEDMDYSFTSQTPGVVFTSNEITDIEGVPDDKDDEEDEEVNGVTIDPRC